MTGPRKGSTMDICSRLEVGQRAYVDTTKEQVAQLMHALNPVISRRPAYMRDWKFSTQCFNAVPVGKLGEVRILVCVERTE